MRFYIVLAFLLVPAIALTGCAGTRPLATPPAPSAVENTDALLAHFEHQGVNVWYEGPKAAAFLSPPAHQFSVPTGGVIQVLEYSDGAEIDADVQVMVRELHGRRTAHLYRRDKLVVLYYGNEPNVMDALTDAMGTPVG